MNQTFYREITPLNQSDCLLVFDRNKACFDFPVHFHPEYELNFIAGAPGATRVVGNHMEPAEDLELVLTGPNLAHGWEQGKCVAQTIHEITIQFHPDLFPESFLQRNIMLPIQKLLQDAEKGLAFPSSSITMVRDHISELTLLNGLESYLHLLKILEHLSKTPYKVLNSFPGEELKTEPNERLQLLMHYIQQNYQRKLKVSDAAHELNMTEVTLGRLIRQHTGKSFIEFLNDTRLGFACRALLECDDSVGEIAFRCGFNNQANFNRIFKKKYGETPSEYRLHFSGIKRFN